MTSKRLTYPLLIGIWLALLSASLLRASEPISPPSPFPEQTQGATTKSWLPLVAGSWVLPNQQLCRLGTSATSQIGVYQVAPLRLRWFLDWTVTAQPSLPDGIRYLPMVRLNQTADGSYTSSPSASELPALVARQPGATWVIGNEPDRPEWQDSLEPGVYARAYHDLYQIIKQADPSARVAIAGVVQPTPLRLKYLEMVLEAYRKLADGTPMPIDVWTLHAFILHERSCTAFPQDCWGAEIPPGVSATQGMLYTIDDHGRLDIFQGFIKSFRDWMALQGYRDRPLLITEFGILMPADYGFGPARVNTFMQGTFDFMATATGPAGYPADENRLVQGWAWYSLDAAQENPDHTLTPLNGSLIDANTRQWTVFGDKFAAIAASMRGDVNLRPLAAKATRSGADVALSVTVGNSGNAAVLPPVQVRFYRGDPATGGTPIATELWVDALDGCGATMTVTSTWTGAPATAEQLWVVVDPANSVAERNESDNTLSFTLASR